jgi:hypothetical protein
MKNSIDKLLVMVVAVVFAESLSAQSGFVLTGGTVYSASNEVGYSVGSSSYRQTEGATASVLSGPQAPAGCTDV